MNLIILKPAQPIDTGLGWNFQYRESDILVDKWLFYTFKKQW